MPAVRVSKHRHSTSTGIDFIAESALGQVYYRIFKPKWYPEEQDDFELPEQYRRSEKKEQQSQQQATDDADSETRTLVNEDTPDRENSNSEKKKEKDAEKGKSKDEKEKDPNVVDWYSEDDPANPMNWSLFKKNCVTAQLCLLTFSIYIGSAIYSPGYESLNQDFGVSSVVATLGLTLFVLGYGIGPLFLSAPSEIPQIGRNPPYMITLFLFVILQIPSALVNNFAGLMVLRFLAGFIGSPVLATGGASIGDMFTLKTRPYAIGIWGLSAVQGPVLGPLLGGFAIQAKNWRWFAWILLMLDGACFLVLLWTMPETSSTNILTRRAQRLRKLTGNDKLRSQGEIDGDGMKLKDLAYTSLVAPFILSFTEPTLFACNLYIGLVYSILYVWIESFQLVFVQMHGFNLGENGLAFMGLFVGALLAYVGFCFYNRYVIIPKIRKNGGSLSPEDRLPPAMVGALFMPPALLWFGWTSDPSIHWISPILASMFFAPGIFLLFNAILNYLQDAYPAKQASVLAGNDFFRSSMASGFPLFAPFLFKRLGGLGGVAWGSTLLAGLTLIFVPIPYVLHRYGKQIRHRSKNARHDI